MKDNMDMLLERALSTDESVDPAVNERLLEKASAAGGKESYMRKSSMKKWIPVAAAVALCVIPVSVYAGSKISSYVAIGSADSQYQSYGEIEKASKKAGFTFDSVESFSNGYTFQEMSVIDTDKIDEDGHKAGTFTEWDGEYSKAGSPDISLTVHETQPEDAEVEDYQEVRKLSDADGNEYDVFYGLDHYKFVPEGYELTEEDKANEGKGNYYISEGAEEVEEMDYSHIRWSKDGKEYMLMVSDTDLSVDELFGMAEEVLK